MNRSLTSLFARRYFRSRGSLSVITIISRVSTVAVAVPVAAMVILLSVFNGFAGLVEGMYNDFDADLLIKPAQGKHLIISDLERVRGVAGIEAVSFVLEESVMVEYRGAQILATMRGVDTAYRRVVPIEKLVADGSYELEFGEMDEVVVGRGIAYALGVNVAFYNAMTFYAPRRGEYSSLLPIANYTAERAFPSGIFVLDAQTDNKYILTSIEFAARLLNYEGRATGVMVRAADVERVQRELRATLGEEYRVLNRAEQNPSMYQIIRLEKWAIFFISLLVLIIASCSVVGTLVMLILDKRRDVATIRTIGGDVGFVRRVFVSEGMLISGIGIMAGVLLGVAFCLVQQHWGLIKIGGESFVVDAYPVVLKWSDVVLVLAAAIGINWAVARLTVGAMLRRRSVVINS